MSFHKRMVMVVMGTALVGTLAGCRESSRYAEGSGYGVGRARTHWLLGEEPQRKGDHVMLGVRAASERGIGQVFAPRDTDNGQAKR